LIYDEKYVSVPAHGTKKMLLFREIMFRNVLLVREAFLASQEIAFFTFMNKQLLNFIGKLMII